VRLKHLWVTVKKKESEGDLPRSGTILGCKVEMMERRGEARRIKSWPPFQGTTGKTRCDGMAAEQ
jgi:hypothetical protein